MTTPDASALARRLAAGEVTAAALAANAFAAISEKDAAIRAFIATLPESAAAEAAASDARRLAGRALGPLDGIPFAVKDNLSVAGVPTTCGTAAFANPAVADSSVVARLRAAGAVLIGTLNMHEGALGATTDNPFHGRCENPLAAGFTPGGSSGGSAAAIAAHMVPLTLGTDTMGSVRIPAAYCGLWGLKPSRGRISVAGLVHLSWTLDSIGPLARSPADLAVMLAVLEGYDPADPTSRALTPPMINPGDVAGLRLGVPDVAALADCEAIVIDSFQQSAEQLRAAGAMLVPVAIAGWEPGVLRRAGLLISEVEGAAILGDVLDAPGLSAPFRSMLDYGRRAPSVKVAQAYRKAQQAEVAALNALEGLDGLLLPTAPQRAFAHDSPVPANQADFTALANAAGLPALSLPTTSPDGGLPTALQIVGPWGSDARLIAIGALVHDLLSPRATDRALI